MMNRASKTVYIMMIYGFLYLPILVLCIYSFNNASYSSLWHGFTMKWYAVLLQDNDLLRVVIHSLTISTIAATTAVILGTLAAVALYRYHFKGKQIFLGSIFVLIILPDIVMGIALLILYHALHIPLGFWTLLIAHITFCLPFVIITVLARMSDFDENIFEAARDLGASEAIMFLRIIVPMLLPAIIASWLLSFTLSMDDVIISFFVSGPSYQILPLYIYSLVRLGIKPEINALCTIMFAVTLVLVTCSQILFKKKL